MRYLHSLADNRPASAGSIFPLAGQWPRAEWIRRLSFESPLFGFGSLQRTSNRARYCFRRQPASGLSRFNVLRFVPAVFSATPLRRRLTSFAPATVDRNQSCVTGLILGGVPLSVPDGFGLVDPSVVPSVNEGRPASTTLMGFFLTLRSFNPAITR